MTKYTVKAEVDNVIQNEDGTFDYNQKVVSMKWNERKGHTQDGTGPGAFGPDYSERKKFHLDYHADWEHPTHTTRGKPLHPVRHKSEWIHAHDDGRAENPPHGVGIDPYDLKPIKRTRTTPLTKEEIEHRHKQLKKDHEGYEYASDRDKSRTHKD